MSFYRVPRAKPVRQNQMKRLNSYLVPRSVTPYVSYDFVPNSRNKECKAVKGGEAL